MKYTKYEVARIIGARALQLSMGAPFLIKRPEGVFDTLVLAKTEYDKGVLPITIKRPAPIKLEFEKYTPASEPGEIPEETETESEEEAPDEFSSKEVGPEETSVGPEDI